MEALRRAGVLKCHRTLSVCSGRCFRAYEKISFYVFVICNLYGKKKHVYRIDICIIFMEFCFLRSMDAAFDTIAMHLLGTVSVNIFKSI